MEVSYQHQLAAGLLNLRVQNPSAIRGNSQAACRTQVKRFFETSNRPDLIGRKVQKLDGTGGIRCRDKIQAPVHYCQMEVVTQVFKNLSALTTFHRHPLEAGCRKAFRVIEEFAIRRLERREAAISRHLDRLAAVRGNLKHLLLSCASRIKKNPASIPRPARVSIIRWMRGHALWLPPVRADHIDVVLSCCI